MLQKMGDVMERANFHELEKSQVLKLLAEHESSDGIRVRVSFIHLKCGVLTLIGKIWCCRNYSYCYCY